MSESSERFRRVAEGLTATIERIDGDAWSRPSPCPGWDARDVVRHIVTWMPGPGFLLGAYAIETGPIPSVDDDPAGAWAAVRDAIQRGLDDPAVAESTGDDGPAGSLTFEAAVDLTCTPDVLIHTWDLARAAGVGVELDADELARHAASIDTMEPGSDEMMRTSGHFGPRVDCPAGADDLTKVLAFFGRSATP